jgi:hypothetical protein
MLDLQPFKLDLLPAPAATLQAVARGVVVGDVPSHLQAQALLGGALPPEPGVTRAPDGRVLITCVTDMPRVTPRMMDWWFGWHLPSSERYRLWHPQAHVAARVKEDRSTLPDLQARYVGNESHVDEYIGAKLMHLTIAFVPPSQFGISDLQAQGATAICAWTTDRSTQGRGGCLCHYIVPTPGGAQMRSAFWLGEIRHNFALVGLLVNGVLNTPLLRRALVPDRMVLDLLRHCGEEMNHLARFLPDLYRAATAADPAAAPSS